MHISSEDIRAGRPAELARSAPGVTAAVTPLEMISL